MTEADEFSPEDVFGLFPTAFPMRPRPEPEIETTTAQVITIGSTVESGPEFYFGINGTWIFGEAEDTIILPILLGLIGVCSILGNGFVMFVILAVRRMRTGPNLMILNITVSDMVFILLCVPTAITNHATPTGGLPPPDFTACKFVHYMIFVTAYVSIYSLVVACVFRFSGDYMTARKHGEVASGINNPLLSRGNAVLSSFVIWVAFFISHLNFLIQPGGAVFQEPFICLHTFVLPDVTKMRTLWVTFLSCGFLVPLITICSLSAIILHRQRKRQPILSTVRVPPAHHPSPQHQHLHHHPQYEVVQNAINEKRNRREITMVLMASMVTRAVCWLPIQIFIMVDIFGMTDITEVYRKAEMLGVCTAFAGTCINPILYNCLSFDLKCAFNETFRKMGCTCISDKVEEDASDMNETIMSIISESSNHINYT